MADEQPLTDTSACVPAHELEDHDRSEIEILRESLRGPEAEPAPVASQGPSEGEPTFTLAIMMSLMACHATAPFGLLV
jgi:hypothetical protein